MAIKSITDCFENIFIATKLERIIYAGFERLKADINCMEDLIYFQERSLHPNLKGIVSKSFKSSMSRTLTFIRYLKQQRLINKKL